MVRDTLFDQLSGTNPRPNKFTIGMGKLIRAAREEAGYSQRELAELIYRRQAALSDMENGKMEPDASTLLLLSNILKKPMSYWFPSPWKPESFEEMTEDEHELLMQTRKLEATEIKKIVAQIKALADYRG